MWIVAASRKMGGEVEIVNLNGEVKIEILGT